MYWPLLISHFHPEDGNWNVCRNVRTASTYEPLKLQNLTLYLRHSSYLSKSNVHFLRLNTLLGKGNTGTDCGSVGMLIVYCREFRRSKVRVAIKKAWEIGGNYRNKLCVCCLVYDAVNTVNNLMLYKKNHKFHIQYLFLIETFILYPNCGQKLFL